MDVKRTRIGELLVGEGLLSREKLDEALTAQQIYGGRLGTVLVEHGLVHEVDLARVLGKQYGVAVISRNELLNVRPEIIALVPPGVARRFLVVPFAYREDRERIVLAICDPTNLHVLDELQFVLGKNVELHMCPEIVLARALEKYYGVARDVRFIKLDFGGAQSGRTREQSPARPSQAGGVLGRIVEARSKQDLLETVVDALTAFGREVVFFAVNGQHLAGWSSRGLRVPPQDVQAVSIPIASSSVLRAVLSSREPAMLDEARERALREPLAERLFMECDERVVIVPLVVQDHVVGAFVIARLEPGRVADPTLLAELMTRVSLRLQAIDLMAAVAAPLAGCP